MDIVALNRFDFSAARQVGGRWRGDNFCAWVGAMADEFPGQAAGAVFNRFDRANLNSVLESVSPTTVVVAQAAWDELRLRLAPTANLESLHLAEEDGDAASITASQAWHITRGGFSAAHRTHAPALTDMENLALYGKCDNPAGHGHNYWFEVWSRPSLTAGDETGNGLAPVIQEFDHKNLSADIPDLRDRNVLTETVAAIIARRVPSAGRVRVWETPDFYAEYRQGEVEYRLGRQLNFRAAYRSGESIVGHNFQLLVVIKSPLDPRTEAAFDLGQLDRIAAGVLAKLDHSFLNQDVSYFRDRPVNGPTLVRYLCSRFQAELGRLLESVRVQDTPRSRFYAESD